MIKVIFKSLKYCNPIDNNFLAEATGGLLAEGRVADHKIFVNSQSSLTKITVPVESKGSHPNSIPPFKKTPVESIFKWRSGVDSSPRYSFSTIYRFSKPTPSASRPPLHNLVFFSGKLKSLFSLSLEDDYRLGAVRRYRSFARNF